MPRAPLRGLFLLGALSLLSLPRAAHAAAPPRIVWVDDELRVRRADAGAALAAGAALPAAGGEVRLSAFRGETVAFQIVIVAGGAPVPAASLTLTEVMDWPATDRLRAAVYAERYLVVDRRSRNARRPAESLGWLPGARPPDAEVLGEVPDPLFPGATAPPIPAGQTGAFWIDLTVSEDAPPGRYRRAARLDAGTSALARFDVVLDVGAPRLPYRATSVVTFYETAHLVTRFGAGAPAQRAERQLWQLFHAHQIDALAQIDDGADLARLAVAYDGSLFTRARGYDGPGAGLAPAVIALGTYGSLKAPTLTSLARLDGMLARLPAGWSGDLFLYAVDEQCQSPLPGDWERVLRTRPSAGRLRIGATCGDPPARQQAQIAMLPAATYARDDRREAEAAGKRAWIYNGVLPRTGTLLLDADPRGLTANGWIAALADVDRWFYWESTFWEDDGPGGHGRVDPFVTAETFHNRDGDSCLGDGLLVYPGPTGVWPSLRLQAIRRGIEDAGLLALALREQPEEVARIVDRVLPAALDETPPDRRAPWETAALRFGPARAALRALVTRADPLTAGERGAGFRALAARRAHRAPAEALTRWRPRVVARVALALVVLAAAATTAGALGRRRRRTRIPGR